MYQIIPIFSLYCNLEIFIIELKSEVCLKPVILDYFISFFAGQLNDVAFTFCLRSLSFWKMYLKWYFWLTETWFPLEIWMWLYPYCPYFHQIYQFLKATLRHRRVLPQLFLTDDSGGVTLSTQCLAFRPKSINFVSSLSNASHGF